jgi:signal transduction histidine kinase/ligand-binding sensor domain-containing protein
MKRLIHCSCLLASLPLLALFHSAAEAEFINSAFFVRTWLSDDGLPNNAVNSIAQTRDGFLWLATPNRLARFDGVRFENFSLPGMARNQQLVNCAMTGRDGSLWLGVNRGTIVRLRDGNAEIFTNDLPDLFPQTLTEDAAGAIWITFNRGTACRLSNGIVTRFTESDGWPLASVASLTYDKSGRVWFAKGGRLGVFRDGHFETLCQLPRPTARILGARDGGVWISCGPQLLRFVEGGELKILGTRDTDSPDSEAMTMLEDRSGAIWIGTRANGLFRFANAHFENVPVSQRQILSLAEDREGNIWVGTAGGGLNRIQPRAIELQEQAGGLPFETVRSICQDAHGAVWAVTVNGLLIRRDGNEWETISTNANWPGGAATCVAADKNGAVWVGTQNRAAYGWRDGELTILRKTNGLTGRATQALLVGKNGDVWIGQSVADALLRWHDGKLTNIPLPQNGRVIQSIVEDSAGQIWVGTSGGRLLRVTGEMVVNETASTTDMPPIRCLCAVPDGTLWIGCSGAGIARFKNGKFQFVGAEQGLLDDNISELIFDAQGWLWCGSDHGVFKIRVAELNAVADGRANRLRSIRYGRDEGLQSLQAEYGHSPGALESRDGRLWMPMRTGLLVIDPDKLPENLPAAPVLIQRAIVDDRLAAFYGGVLPVSNAINLGAESSSLRLDPSHRRLEFDFTALTFAAPHNVFFRYRLHGFDENWTEAGGERRAIYSRLPAGNYRLEVQDCNTSGVWNERAAQLNFSVAPFFWQTWWFRAIAIATFTASVAGIVRYVSYRRLRANLRAAEQQAALERERARIARDIHDDLGNRLTKIMLLSGRAARDETDSNGARRESFVEEISATAQQATDALDEIVWAINPQNDTLPHLINYLGQFAVEFLRAANIRCRVDLPDHPPHKPVPADIRHNLFLIVKESLSNIVRHANATEVLLRFSQNDGSTAVTIEDDGCGFVENDRDGADGLRNMRERSSEIGADLKVESAPGKGTKIILNIPRLHE